MLLVHAGDAISPSLLSGFDKGAHMVELLNRVPLDVFVMGNHEFDFGPDVAKERIGEAKFAVVNSNVTDRDGSLFAGTVESRMIEVRGFKLGFFGLTTPDTTFLASPGYAGFKPLLETAQAMAAKLRREGADLVSTGDPCGFGDDLPPCARERRRPDPHRPRPRSAGDLRRCSRHAESPPRPIT